MLEAGGADDDEKEDEEDALEGAPTTPLPSAPLFPLPVFFPLTFFPLRRPSASLAGAIRDGREALLERDGGREEPCIGAGGKDTTREGPAAENSAVAGPLAIKGPCALVALGGSLKLRTAG